MASTGLQDLLELIYAPNAVVHMLSGKAIARAVRGHFIVDAALNALMLADALNVPLPRRPDGADDFVSEREELTEEGSDPASELPTEWNEDLDEAASLFKKLMEGDVSIEEAAASDALQRINEQLTRYAKSLKMSSRTSALWLQYMGMVDILRKYIRAERTGNWNLHLQAIQEMLPYRAASGHNLYTKSARLYVQQMSDLEAQHPAILEKFQQGLHVVRRSDRRWAGLSTDLIIEQVLMRNMKTSGGLTRGRGMTEQQRTLWLLSTPACAEVNKAMQKLTGVNYNTGEQNKDMTKARQARDWKDTLTVLQHLKERNPFSSDPSLRNIATGVHAHSTVNVDTAMSVGTAILQSMDGKTAAEYTFKKKDQTITLATKSSVKIGGDEVQIDPQLLFQRLITAAKTSEDLESAFRYELCSYPSALFVSPMFLREPHKPALADAIWQTAAQDASAEIPPDVQYVLDGGALIQRIPWAHGAKYKDIYRQYTDYVSKRYGEAVVVFDGYEGTSTKDMTHQRRTRGITGATVAFTEDMDAPMKKEHFLANKNNKQRFINMLGKELKKQHCQVYHAVGDADVLIVQKAVEWAATTNTVLVGDDTDLLILLCYHANLRSNDLFFCPEQKNAKKIRVWNIKAIKEQLGSELCENILFLHGILGCDTTSRLYGIGKGASLKRFKKNAVFREQAKVFNTPSASPDNVIAAGEKALVAIYNGKPSDTLDSLRYKRFCEKVASNSSYVQPQSLPPTSAATKYHSLRVYLQVQEWQGSTDGLLPSDWGWQECEGRFLPRQTDLAAAPEKLLQVIRCNCQSDCSSI
jgi:hypothetical protein